MASSAIAAGYRFGPYELNLRSYELRRNGRPVRIQDKPLRLLIALAERPGELVNRAELRERLWPQDTFVVFEDGLNTSVRKLREVLGDDPQSPRYIETVRGHGYRLMMAVSVIHPEADSYREDASRLVPGQSAMNGFIAAELPQTAPASEPAAQAGLNRHSRVWAVALIIGSVGAVCFGVSSYYWLVNRDPGLAFRSHGPVLIADFDNETGNPRFDTALYTALLVSLQQSPHFDIYSRLQAAHVLRLMVHKENDPITPIVGREICLRENLPGLIVPGITRTGNDYLLTAQLVDPSTGNAVRSYSVRVRGEDRILLAVDAIGMDIRRGLGESRLDIRRSHRSLPEVTTASLQALEAYTDGSVMFHRDRAVEARQLYEKAIAADPGFALAHAALGSAYYSFLVNEPTLGEQEFRKALALSARTTPRERSLIQIRYAESQRRIADALALLKNYLLEHPGDWDTRYAYARLLRMHGHSADSIAIFQQLAQQAPDDPSVFIELATAYKALGQWPRSIQAYERAFSLDQGMLVAGNVNREYGFTLVLDGQVAKAEQVFSALLAGPATYANGKRSLAFLDLYEGKYASAREHLMRALVKTTDPYSIARIRYMLAVVAAGQGKRHERVAELDRIVANFSVLTQKVQYGALVGQAYARAGEVEKAKKLLVVITPLVDGRSEEQVAYAQLLKAEVAAVSGDYRTALGLLKPPQSDASNSTAVLTRESLAHIYHQTGNYDQATNWYTQLLQDHNSEAIGWEPQQQILEAYYDEARDYQQMKAPGSSMRVLNLLLTLWRNADPDLPLLNKAKTLREELVVSR